MKIYTVTAPLEAQFDRNEQTVSVIDLGDKTRVVISGLNAGEVNMPKRVVSDVVMATVDFQKYILPSLPREFKEFN